MNFEVNIRLSFSSDLLTSLEIAVSNAKGIVCQFDLQHPLVYLFNQFNNNNLSYKAVPGLLTYEKQKCYDEFEQQEKVLVPQIESAPTEVIRLLNTSNQAAFEELLESVKQGLLVHDPELVEEGVNGTYFLKNQDGEIVCVFKPKNEEGSSEFNPKNSNDAEIASHLAHGIQPGEAAEREVAAYLLDKTGFFGVPKTTMVEINHKETSKIGSIQQFVENDGASWDIGPGLFPVQEIQKIGLLDLYMLNTDRHGGNILFQENSNRQITLHPIDNGFSLPETIGIDNLWFEWMNWSQSKLPFTEKSKKFLEELNVDEDVAMLREQTSIRSECLSTLKIMGNFVKYSVLNHNKTLYDIGKLVCSNGSDGSELELLCDRVTGICGPLTNDNNDAWFQQFNSELDALFAQ